MIIIRSYCRISPRRTCRPCGFTIKISSRGQRHLIYIVKRNTKTDGMGSLINIFPITIYNKADIQVNKTGS